MDLQLFRLGLRTQVEQTARIARPPPAMPADLHFGFLLRRQTEIGLPGDSPPFGGELAPFDLNDVGTLRTAGHDFIHRGLQCRNLIRKKRQGLAFCLLLAQNG